MELQSMAGGVARRSRPAWLVVGLVIGLVAAPAAAVAATLSVVNIAGPNGTKAVVTKAGQVLSTTVDVGSSQAHHFYGVNPGGGCTPLYTVPGGKSFVLTQVTFDVWADPTPGSLNYLALTTDPTCNAVLLADNAPSVGAVAFPLGQGIVVPAGHKIYGVAAGGVAGDIYLYGYAVPLVAAPHPTPIQPVGSSSAVAGGSNRQP